MKNILYIVVPCYNEEAVLRETASRLADKLTALVADGKVSWESRIMLVNDGSSDSTWQIIRQLAEEDERFLGVALSRNRGHQNALLCGLMTAREMADMVISMDADLQDDIDAVDKMVQCYLDGCDVVYGVRSSRQRDSFFKRFTAESYYKLLHALGCDIVFNHADYRLLSARALDALSGYREQDLFLRGIVPKLGFKTAKVEYERGERFAGESKYPLRKMLALASSGAISLSLKPLRLILSLGIASLFAALLLLIFSIIRAAGGYTLLNWKIIVISIWGCTGLILTALGVVGEYVGRTMLEAKGRPRYDIGDTAGFSLQNGDK